jgi:hypothetical protein
MIFFYSLNPSTFLAEVPKECSKDFEKTTANVSCSQIGHAKKERGLSTYGLKGNRVIDVDLDRLRDGLEGVLKY